MKQRISKKYSEFFGVKDHIEKHADEIYDIQNAQRDEILFYAFGFPYSDPTKYRYGDYRHHVIKYRHIRYIFISNIIRSERIFKK